MTEVLQIWHWPPGYHFKAHCSCHTTNFPAKYCQNVISVVENKNITVKKFWKKNSKFPDSQNFQNFQIFFLTFGTVRSVRPSFGPLTDIFWIIIVRIIVYLTKNKVSRCPRGRTRAARYAQNSISWVVSLLKSWCHTLKSTTLGTVPLETVYPLSIQNTLSSKYRVGGRGIYLWWCEGIISNIEWDRRG